MPSGQLFFARLVLARAEIKQYSPETYSIMYLNKQNEPILTRVPWIKIKYFYAGSISSRPKLMEKVMQKRLR